MAKVVVTSLRVRGGKTNRTEPRIESRVVRTEDGQVATIRTLDAHGDKFGVELDAVFRRNVRKARSDNKRVTGQTDFVPAKS